MASGGHTIQQQKDLLETRIKQLINNDLKEICKAYDYQVSGNKAVLQKRCIEILDDLVSKGDEVGFTVLNYRVRNHGASPPRAKVAAPNINNMNGNGPTYGMAAGYPRPQQPAQLQPHGARFFKSSPFYEIKDTILSRQELPEMPQNRHTVRAVLALSPDHVRQLRDDPNMRLLMYCGMNVNMMGAVDVSFPNQLEVKINGDDVRANYKGLKGKPGTTKPADLTDSVRKTQGYQNQLSVTYALTKNKFTFVVLLARRISADTLTQLLKSGRVGGSISKQTVINEMKKANSDEDISATSVRMSLKDPISTLRITLPVRSSHCRHNQCFDGSMFLQLQDQAPQWSCPVCSKTAPYESLCIDKYFEEILQKTPSSIEKVDIEPDGEWRVIKEEEDAQPNNGTSSKGGRAAYDDDFDDDDLIDITDDMPKPPNGVPPPVAKATPAMQSPAFPAFPMNTPPLSSRDVSRAPSMASTQQPGTKRSASAVVDLTLSDDEDEPPRSAKRQTMSTHPGTSAQSYSTPSSLPDPRYASYPTGQTHVTDSSRPSGNSARPVSNGRSDYYPSNYPLGSLTAGTGSPLRQSASASPGYGGTPNWSAQLPRPPIAHPTGPPQAQQPSPFSIRPLSASPAQQGRYNLPPMQTQPQNTYDQQWRAFDNHGFGSSGPSK